VVVEKIAETFSISISELLNPTLKTNPTNDNHYLRVKLESVKYAVTQGTYSD
jgi:hypothetical protein